MRVNKNESGIHETIGFIVLQNSKDNIAKFTRNSASSSKMVFSFGTPFLVESRENRIIESSNESGLKKCLGLINELCKWITWPK